VLSLRRKRNRVGNEAKRHWGVHDVSDRERPE
jgi:hypothetical protein